MVQVVEDDAYRVVADRLQLDDPDLGAAGDELLLVRAVTLHLGRWALHPQQLGRQPERRAVVEIDLQDLLRLAQTDLGRPVPGPERRGGPGPGSVPPAPPRPRH